MQFIKGLLKNTAARHSKGEFCPRNLLSSSVLREKQIPRSARNDNAVLAQQAANLLVFCVVLAATAAWAQGPMPSYKGIGAPATKEQIQVEDISVGPEGKGLPPGSGSAKEGAAIFADKCAVCHGASGEGAQIGPALVTAKNVHDTLTTMKPVRSLAAYWPYATMVWDYIHRAMPRGQGGTLMPNEVYSLTAFILYKNGIIQEGEVLDAKTLPKVQMPNRNGFTPARFSDIPDEKKRGCHQGICP